MKTTFGKNQIRNLILTFMSSDYKIGHYQTVKTSTKYVSATNLVERFKNRGHKISKGTVIKYLKELAEENYVGIEGHQRGTRYYLLKEYQIKPITDEDIGQALHMYINNMKNSGEFKRRYSSIEILLEKVYKAVPDFKDTANELGNELYEKLDPFLSYLYDAVSFSSKFLVEHNICFICGFEISDIGMIQSYTTHKFITAPIQVDHEAQSIIGIFEQPKSVSISSRIHKNTRFRAENLAIPIAAELSHFTKAYQDLINYCFQKLSEKVYEPSEKSVSHYQFDTINHGIIHPKCIPHSANDGYSINTVSDVENRLKSIYAIENGVYNQRKELSLFPNLLRTEEYLKQKYTCPSCSFPIFLGFTVPVDSIVNSIIDKYPLFKLNKEVLVKDRIISFDVIKGFGEDFDLLLSDQLELISSLIVQFRVPYKLIDNRFAHIWCDKEEMKNG